MSHLPPHARAWPVAAALLLLSPAVTLMPPAPAHAAAAAATRTDPRAAAPIDTHAATGADARALYLTRCGICHLEGGTGTFMLSRRLGKQRALLADRTDLTAAYVEAVVRNGLNSMPAFTRVEITDQELAAVAGYLAHRDGSAAASRRP